MSGLGVRLKVEGISAISTSYWINDGEKKRSGGEILRSTVVKLYRRSCNRSFCEERVLVTCSLLMLFHLTRAAHLPSFVYLVFT